MKSPKEELLAIIEKMAGIPILVVGDVILDRYIWGRVDRISQEAPVPVVEIRKTESRLGGAANVARNLSNLGAKVLLCGVIGGDADGQEVVELLKGAGIELSGVVVDGDRPTTVKTRVIAQGQQIVRFDREERVRLLPHIEAQLLKALNVPVERYRAVILSDYGKGVVTPGIMENLTARVTSGAYNLATRPFVVDPHPSNYSLYRRMNVAKPNRSEAEAASGVTIRSRSDAIRAAKLLLPKWGSDLVVITLGDSGLVIVGADGQQALELDTVAREVYDVSGAGDAVTAIFSAALAAGGTNIQAGDLANVAAGIVVSEVGTAAVERSKLRSEIELLDALARALELTGPGADA